MSDDIVETSDAEELEVRHFGGFPVNVASQRQPRDTPPFQTPRKRRKYGHGLDSHGVRELSALVGDSLSFSTTGHLGVPQALSSTSMDGHPAPHIIEDKERKELLSWKVENVQPDHAFFSGDSAVSQDDELDLFASNNCEPEDIVPFQRPRFATPSSEISQSVEPFAHIDNNAASSSPPQKDSLDASITFDKKKADDILSEATSPPASSPRTSSSVVDDDVSSEQTGPLHGSELLLHSRALPQARQVPPSEDIPQELLDEVQSGRRYSLRARQARQLNPYSIEKHFYKQQMRNNPDAIVKVISPRRLHGEHGHSERNEWDEDFVVPDDGTQGSPRRRQTKRPEETNYMPKQWMPEAFSLFEEDDLTGHAKSGRVSPKHRHKPQKFPLRLSRDKLAPVSTEPVYVSSRQTNRDAEGTQEAVSPQRTTLRPVNGSYSPSNQVDFSSMDSSGDFDQAAPLRLADSMPQVTARGESPDENDLGLNRQQRKALSRVMPRFMINRMLKKGHVEAKSASKPRRTASPEGQSSDDSHHDANSSQNAFPRAGRSRIRKRDTASSSTPLAIKGDTESSSSESDIDRRDASAAADTNPAVIEIDSSSSSDSSDESGFEILDDAHPRIRRSPGPRREISLIDRMLSRTRTGKTSGQGKGKRRHDHKNSRPNYDYLDMRVGFDRSRTSHGQGRHNEKQSKLPYAQRDISASREFPYAGHSSPLDDAIDVAIEGLPDPYRRKSKKERRDALRKDGVHTFTGSGGLIGHGRRKGHMQVQIDMADDHLRYALQPLDSNLPQAPGHRQAPSSSSSVKRPRIRLSGRHRTPGVGEMKQSSLHDFTYPTEGVDFDFQSSAHRYPSPPESEHQMDRLNEAKLAECTIDLNIATPSPGRMFNTTSYLGRQCLSDLIEFLKSEYVVTSPPHFHEFEIELDAYAPPENLCKSLEAIHLLICDEIEKINSASEESDIQRMERLSRAMFLHIPWAISKSDQETCLRINNTLTDLTFRAVEKTQPWFDEPYKARLRLNESLFAALWFLVEANTRAYVQTIRRGFQADHIAWKQIVVLTIRFLILYGVEKAVEAITSPELPSSGLPIRIAGIWISLVFMIPHIHTLPSDSNASYGPVWSLLLEVVKTDRLNFGSDVELSEQLWRLVFSLSSLSRFSIRGVCTSDTHLPFSWDFISYVLDTIRLTGDAVRDAKLPSSSLRKRDKYVRIVVARCFLLVMRWKWPLRNAHSMLKRLIDIFKSRSFGNLIGEKPDFPAFLRHYDISLMSTLDRSDTAFNLFLKLVVHAVKINSGTIDEEQREKARITKLLSLAIPLSRVPFTKTAPPVGEELSLLVNRYSAIITAIYVEPTLENVRTRLSRARSYLDFLNADDSSRAVCIRAVMYSAVLVKHLSLPLDEPVRWLTEIGDALLAEYKATHREMQSKALYERQVPEAVLRRIRTTVQLLLGCMRNIIERSRFADVNPADDGPVYPDVSLIKGPWIRTVLSMKDLTADVDIRHQVLLLFRAFLDARVKVMGVPKRPIVEVEDDNSESQELYGDIALDAELLEALDRSEGLIVSDGQSLGQKNKAKDVEVAEAMNSDIIQNIFRLLLQYLLESREAQQHDMTLERFWFNANEWIDCWVSCASVVVQNGLREWDHFMEVGPQSWGGISDSFFRRRVALRFMYKLLQCDPTAYKAERLGFLRVFVEALVSFNITVEHEYVSLLLSIDSSRRGLLSGLPWARNEHGLIELTKQRFLDLRIGLISTIFDNLDVALDSAGNGRLTYEAGTFVEVIVAMMSAMQDISISLTEPNDREKYGLLCCHVHASATKHTRVAGLQRLAPFITWASASLTSKEA